MTQDPSTLADRIRTLEDADPEGHADALAELRDPIVYAAAMRYAKVDVVAAYPASMRREERRSWWWGIVLAGRIAADPDAAVAHARERLPRVELAAHRAGTGSGASPHSTSK